VDDDHTGEEAARARPAPSTAVPARRCTAAIGLAQSHVIAIGRGNVSDGRPFARERPVLTRVATFTTQYNAMLDS